MAVDPGITTGMAFHIGTTIKTCVATDPNDVLDMLEGAHKVVIERFVGDVRLNAVRIETLTLLGMVMGWCVAKDVACFPVMPGARKPFQSQANKLAGLGHMIHEEDALAHLLAWEYRQGPARAFGI